jgi:VIT1/CCC1 family predicted Fe2+/Mn2+ transporter
MVTSGTPAVLISAGLSLGTLFGVGAGMSFLTGRSLWLSGARMMAIGAGAAAITYGVGKLLNVGTGA